MFKYHENNFDLVKYIKIKRFFLILLQKKVYTNFLFLIYLHYIIFNFY